MSTINLPKAKCKTVTHRELVHERLWPGELVKFFLTAYQDKDGNLCYLYDDVIKAEKHLSKCSVGVNFQKNAQKRFA